MAKPVTLAKFGMLCDQREFVHLYWDDEPQHVTFLTDCMKEGGIDITPWVALGDAGSGPSLTMQRSVSAWHPLPIQLPWLPLMIRNKCVQTVSYNRQTNLLHIIERSAVNGIPFVQPYVIATWTIAERAATGQGAGSKQLDIHVGLSWEYDVYSFLAGQVEFYSRGAMDAYFKAWLPHADSLLVARRKAGGDVVPQSSGAQGALVKAMWAPWSAGDQAGAAAAEDEETWRSSEDQAGEMEAAASSPVPVAAEGARAAPPSLSVFMSVMAFLRKLLEAVLRLISSFALALPSSQQDEPEAEPELEPEGSDAAEEVLLRESALEALRLSRARPFAGSSVAGGYSGATEGDGGFDSSPDSSPARSWTPQDLRKARRAKMKRLRNLDLDPTHTGAINAGAGLLCNLSLENLFQGQPRIPTILQRPAFSDAAYRAGSSAPSGPPRRVPDTVMLVQTTEELLS